MPLINPTQHMHRLIRVALAFRWGIVPEGTDRWRFVSPSGRSHAVGSDRDGLPQITEEVRRALEEDMDGQTGTFPAISG